MAKVTEQRYQQTIHYFAEPLPGILKLLNMVFIPGGTFLMGSPEDEKGRSNNESPQHSVTVPSFFISEFLITQAQWAVVAKMQPFTIKLEMNPARFKDNDRPVETISWFDAVEFCQRLSRQTRRTYRLPSDAEWEYACRAGTTTPFHCGETITTDLANYDNNTEIRWDGEPDADLANYDNKTEIRLDGEPKVIYLAKTTPVDTFSPNAFGLYDMHGNVWEWCLDHGHENYEGAPIDGSAWIDKYNNSSRIVRGGAFADKSYNCRSAVRDYFYTPSNRYSYIGFRVVCDMPEIFPSR
jgi:formylglycine-generating enzyme required for sulfatase activity